jgi:hypothetical protein
MSSRGTGRHAYAKRYRVDRYSAYDDLAALGCQLPTRTELGETPTSVVRQRTDLAKLRRELLDEIRPHCLS